MDQYLGKFVRLCSTGTMRNRGYGGSFVQYYYTKEERCVYGKVHEWNSEWDSGHAGPDISRLLPEDSIQGYTALLPVNLEVEFTVEEISKKDYPDILSQLEQGYEVEGDHDKAITNKLRRLVTPGLNISPLLIST